MSGEERKEVPFDASESENALPPLQYHDSGALRAEKVGLEQRLSLIEDHNRRLEKKSEEIAELRSENTGLSRTTRSLRSELKSVKDQGTRELKSVKERGTRELKNVKDRGTRELKRDKVHSLVSTVLFGIGCSVLGSDIASGSFTWLGLVFVAAGVAVYGCMFWSRIE